MKIIKEGVKPKQTMRFECDKCGCIFECDESETKKIYDQLDPYYGDKKYMHYCPTCGKVVTLVEQFGQ